MERIIRVGDFYYLLIYLLFSNGLRWLRLVGLSEHTLYFGTGTSLLITAGSALFNLSLDASFAIILGVIKALASDLESRWTFVFWVRRPPMHAPLFGKLSSRWSISTKPYRASISLEG